MLTVLVSGFGAGVALIVAIGAQNAFVLRQGIRREHVGPLCLLCALADVGLITAGMLGLGLVVEWYPAAVEVMRWAGVAFLIAYAGLALYRAFHPATMAVDGRTARLSLLAVLAQGAAFTFLNPHVYLDTVLLLGSLANTHGTTLRWAFMAGASLASFTWFFALGYGAKLLQPVFAKPRAWQVLDTVIAAVMLFIALSLTLTPLSA
jgi:L-lysine exporter family protein LysE/ArgO